MGPAARHNPPRVLGYVRVSTDEQFEHGNGLAAQKKAILAESERRGWELLEVVAEDSGASAKSLKRPGIQRALETLRGGEADILLVAKIDRLTRSLADGASLMQVAIQQCWSLVSCDTADVDMSTPTGEALAGNMLVFAQLERRLISDRTRAALAAKRARGERIGGKQILGDDVLLRILRDRESGLSMGAIAARLEAEHVPTAHQSSYWHASTIRRVLLSQRAAELREC